MGYSFPFSLLPEEGGRNRSKCSALYTSSLKAGYSYSLFMKLHNLILRLNQRFLKMSVVTLLLSPSLGRGTPEGQGIGRRRNRAKPTSGATRHLLPEEGGRNRSKCSALYTSSLKAGYSYSLFMNLHNLILRLNQPFLNTRRFSPLRMTKCALPLPPNPLNL